jgi:anti-anti-sigma factor
MSKEFAYHFGRGIEMNVLHHESITGIHLVNLQGPLNGSRAEEVVRLFEDLSEQGVERVLVNLEHVPFIDSRGLAALIAGYKIFGGRADRCTVPARGSQGGQNFRLAGIRNQPRLVLELTGFDYVFQIFGRGAETMAPSPHSLAIPGWDSLLLAPQPVALDWVA